MLRGEWFARAVRFAVRRPLVVVGVLAVLVLGGAALAVFKLQPSSSTDSLVGKGSRAYAATQRFKTEFGDEAVVILAQGELQRLVLTSNLNQFVALEGCIGGKAPAKALAKLPAPCQKLAKLKPARAVYGPGTFINTAISGAEDFIQQKLGSSQKQAQDACNAATAASKARGDSPAQQKKLCQTASQVANQQLTQQFVQLYARYGISNPQSLQFIAALVFDSARGANTPKQRFAYLFPSSHSAMITIRLRPDLSDAQRSRAISLIQQAVREPAFKLTDGSWTVSGVPVVVEGLAKAVGRAIFMLLGLALVVMALALALVFRTRMRLLPLALALAVTAIVYGGLALVGGKLTMASIAVLPVLIGLSVDYAIQFHARFDEQLSRGREPEVAAVAAAQSGGPTIATACLATAAGLLMLFLSPVPMVRDFGAMLVVGVIVAFVVVVMAGFAVLSWSARRAAARPDVPPLLPRARSQMAAFGVRARTSRPAVAVGRFARSAFELSLRRPKEVLGVAVAVALIGLVAGLFHEVTSDVRKLVPQNLQSLRDADTLQRATGVSGELDITVTAPDLTQPAVLQWMTRFQEKVLKDHGYKTGGASSCQQKVNPPELCPALSLPDLFRSGVPNQAGIRQLLDAVPDYFSQAVVSRQPKTRTPKVANLAFGIRLMPLDRQQQVIDDIKAAINDPKLKKPQGLDAEVAGLPVLAAEANAKLASPWWRLLTLVGSLILVFAVLWLLAGRRVRSAAIPLLPVALASGWSGAVLFIIGIPLNPMSVTLGALVVAIATEFSVLLAARYAEERERGVGPAVALERTYASTGAAVIASGVTAIAGFAVLIASNIAMLRQFGISTVVDLTVALIGVLLVLPATLMYTERYGTPSLRDLDPRPLGPIVMRGLRRGRRVPAAFWGLRPRRRA